MSELSVPLRPGRLKRGRPCLPPPPPCLFLFLSLSSSFTSRRQPERRPGWRADAQGLSLRLGPPCQLGAFPPHPPSLLQSRARDLSFPSLPPSDCRPRPTVSQDLTEPPSLLLAHSRQFLRCHSESPSGRAEVSRGAELAIAELLRSEVIFFWEGEGVMIFVLYER